MIPVFVYTDEEMESQKLGLDDDDDAGFEKIETRAFWVIDYANVFREDSTKTSFYVNGDSFVTPQFFKEFVKIIDNHNKQNL